MTLAGRTALSLAGIVLTGFAVSKIRKSICLRQAAEQNAHEEKLTAQQTAAQPDGSQDRDQQNHHHPSIEQDTKVRWKNFVDRNDKVIVALSTVAMAVFSFALFVATCLLWKSGEKHSERSLRAYINITGAYIDNFDGADPPIIRVEVKNSGQTPAYNLRLAAKPIFRAFPYSGPFDIRESDFKPRGMAGSGEVFITGEPLGNPPFTDEQRQAIRSGKAVLFVFGEIRYTDAFRNPRWTKYRFIYGKAVGITGQVFGADENGNEAN